MENIKYLSYRFIGVFKKYTKEDKKILGRWNIENCSKKIDTKIVLSNEDHCGPCGLYIQNKLKSQQFIDKNIN
jgi:hypothetical protein